MVYSPTLKFSAQGCFLGIRTSLLFLNCQNGPWHDFPPKCQLQDGSYDLGVSTGQGSLPQSVCV